MQNNTEVKPDDFRVGDVVWCILHGKGEVIYIKHPVATYLVEVCFEGGDTFWYTKDGRWYQDFNRTLFFSEPKIEASATRPFVSTLIGKNVVVDTLCCGQIVGRVFEETLMQIKLDGGYRPMKDLCTAIYEVSSENLLTK